MYTCTKFQQYITNNRLVVVKYSSAILSLQKKVRNDQRSKVRLSSLDCNQDRRDLCLYNPNFISIDFETVSILESSTLNLQKSVQKRRLLQKKLGSHSFLNKYNQMYI